MTDPMFNPEEEAKQIMSEQVPFVLPNLSDPSNQGAGFGPAVDGIYLLRIVKAEFIKSSQKGTPGINLEMDISSGEYVGKKMWDTLWLTDKSFKRLSWFLKCLGSDLWNKNLSQVQPLALLQMLTGAEVGARVGIESYVGTDTYQGSSTFGQQINKFKNVVREYVPKGSVGQANALAPTFNAPVAGQTTSTGGGFVEKSPADLNGPKDYSIFLPSQTGGGSSGSSDEPPLI